MRRVAAGIAGAQGSGLGLRTKVTLAFAVGATMLSALLAVSTYALAHHYLLSQREASALRQTYANARLVRQDLNATGSDVTNVLSALTPGGTTRFLVYRQGRWFSTSVAVGRSALPPSLVRVVLSGKPAYQLVTVANAPALVVGIPLSSISSFYFEVHILSELQTTLSTLALVLGLMALLIALGGAGLGWWASGRLLRPLREMAVVAEDILGGELDRRLTPSPDADLAPLVTAFNQMVGGLQDRIDREVRFTSDVSHELRSPLTAVETSAEVLSMFRSCLPTEGNRALDLLMLETRRFSGTVETLLEISRMDAGAAELAMEDIDLDELLRYSVSVPETAAPAPLVFAPGSEHIVVHADKRRLLRVMTNLLDNARQHGGGVRRVVVERSGSHVFVSVDDDGPGIPLRERSRVFERFYRGEGPASVRRGGSGLGLALVEEHVRVHGGSVEISDAPGGGARLTIRLPVAAP